MPTQSKIIAAVIGVLLLVVFFTRFSSQHQGSRDIASVPSGQKQDQNNSEVSAATSSKVSDDAEPTTNLPMGHVKKRLTNENKSALKVARGASNQHDKSGRAPLGYKDWFEVSGTKARKKNDYVAAMGDKVAEQSGYIIFSNSSSRASLTEFTGGGDLPVVRRAQSPVLGLVNGDISVKFREYPDSLAKFAEKHNLRVVGEFKNIESAVFAPKNSPENLLELTRYLNRLPEVKEAELSVVFNRLKVR